MAIEKAGSTENLKYMVQIPKPVSAPEKDIEKKPEKEINWAKWGSIGTAAAAIIIGGIYWARSGKSNDAASNAGQKLGEKVSSVVSESKDTLKNLSPFELDMNSNILKFIGKGKDVELGTNINNLIMPSYMPGVMLELRKVAQIDDTSRLLYSEDGKAFKYIGNRFEFFKHNFETPHNGYKSVMVCKNSSNYGILSINEKEDALKLIFEGPNSNIIDINMDKNSKKILSAMCGDTEIQTERAEELLNDFDINKYIADKNFRDKAVDKFTRFIDIENLANKFKKSTDEIEQLVKTSEFAQIIENVRELKSPDTFLSAKCITDNLKNIFGLNQMSKAFERTLNLNENNFFSALYAKKITLDVNANSIVDAQDSVGSFVRFRNGIRITPKICDFDEASNKITYNKFNRELIEASQDGRYIRYTDNYKSEMLYINPKEITDEIPRLTRKIDENGFFGLKEYKDKSILEISLPENSKKLVIEYNPEIKEAQIDKSFIIDLKTQEKQEITHNHNELNEILEIFDFSRISEKDYISEIKSLYERVI